MKNINIEVLKYICAISVVVIHYCPLLDIFRFAVPVFFIISGYFYSYKIEKSFINFSHFLIFYAIYIVIFNIEPDFLWYLATLAFMQFVFLKTKNFDIKKMLFASLCIYLLWFYLFQRRGMVQNENLLLECINNTLLYAPCFLFGLYYKKNTLNIRFSFWKSIFICLVIEVTILFLSYGFLSDISMQESIFQFIVAIILFISFVEAKEMKWLRKYEIVFGLSYYIFLSHFLVVSIFLEFTLMFRDSMYMYIIIYCICFVLVMLITHIISYLMGRYNIIYKIAPSR